MEKRRKKAGKKENTQCEKRIKKQQEIKKIPDGKKKTTP